MPAICPTITATNEKEYREQVERVTHFAHRIHIDLSDGVFAPNKLVKPEEAWWPVGFNADLHVMYRQPAAVVKTLVEHKPNLIIVHAEADGDFERLAKYCKAHNVRVGVALLQKTHPDTIVPALHLIDHVLIFSGDLGYHGGHANMRLLGKLKILRRHKPELEIGWDGGVNMQNASELIAGGVDVLNVGGHIQGSPDPARAFASLQRIADETGET